MSIFVPEYGCIFGIIHPSATKYEDVLVRKIKGVVGGQPVRIDANGCTLAIEDTERHSFITGLVTQEDVEAALADLGNPIPNFSKIVGVTSDDEGDNEPRYS